MSWDKWMLQRGKKQTISNGNRVALKYLIDSAFRDMGTTMGEIMTVKVFEEPTKSAKQNMANLFDKSWTKIFNANIDKE